MVRAAGHTDVSIGEKDKQKRSGKKRKDPCRDKVRDSSPVNYKFRNGKEESRENDQLKIFPNASVYRRNCAYKSASVKCRKGKAHETADNNGKSKSDKGKP